MRYKTCSANSFCEKEELVERPWNFNYTLYGFRTINIFPKEHFGFEAAVATRSSLNYYNRNENNGKAYQSRWAQTGL